MERIKINTSIPAMLTDFEQTENEQFSRAKLKVFYIGETADKRLFTEDFSKDIVKSLPYTPVVSHYDKEKEDFVGHAEQQNIYGIVDPLIKPTFEDIEGKTWAVCGVVLYTERPDETGEIASKIVGKPHSLELNPKTIQYKLNYDKYRKLKNIEFTKGDFVGVSVLGSDQQPAFTGSGFFAADAEFSNKMNLLKNYINQNCAEENRMDARILNFVELSWGEKTSKIYDAMDATYGVGCSWIVDMYDEYFVCHLYHPETESCELVKVNYSFDDNGECTLGTVVPVRVVYEEIKEPNPNASLEGEQPTELVANTEGEQQPVSTNAETTPVEGEQAASEPPVEGITNAEENSATSEPEGAGEGTAEQQPSEPANLENQPTDNGEGAQPTDNEDLSNATNTTSEPNKEGVDGQSDTSTFTESEKAELEALRRNEKVNLIKSFASDLGEEVIAKYLTDVDNFTKDELELALLKQFREIEKTVKKPTMKAFRRFNENNTNSSRTIEELVAQYKNKN